MLGGETGGTVGRHGQVCSLVVVAWVESFTWGKIKNYIFYEVEGMYI